MSPSRRTSHVALGPGAEFDAIRTMVDRWGDLACGIGDDAAVLSIPRGDRLIASVDTAIEGQHFRNGWLTAREIGYRAVTAALSDLAAMAAQPLGVLIALALPPRWMDAVGELSDGIGDAVATASTRILGGNTAAADTFAITTTVLGSAFAPLYRDGLRDGDAIYVTGHLGGPAAALAAWRRGETPIVEHRERFAHPRARLHEARWLADRGATAAIDISDGLAADLRHLAAGSGIGIDVDLERVPLVTGVDDLQTASSGEEYELVVATPTPFAADEFEARFGVPLTLIGRANRSHDGVILMRNGERVANPPGYDHLSK